MSRPTLVNSLQDESLPAEHIAALEDLLANAPEPTMRSAHRAHVLAEMRPLLPPVHPIVRLIEWYPFLLLSRQLSVVRREIWSASALVLVLGLLVTLGLPEAGGFVFAALAPVVAAAGVAALYSNSPSAILELEQATPASGGYLLLARLLLVFSYNLVLGMVGTMVLRPTGVNMLPLILDWLAPMTFLCGFSFFLGMLSASALLAAGASLLLWMLYLILQQTAPYTDILAQGFPSAGLALGGAALVVATLLIQQRSWQTRVRQ